MNTSELDEAILHVATLCGVDPATETLVSYSWVPPHDQESAHTRWSVVVFARSTTARIHTQRKITGSGATLRDAAESAIELVRRGIESGEITTTRGS